MSQPPFIDDFINLSVSGIKYSLCCEDMKKYPSTLLAVLADIQQSGILHNVSTVNSKQYLPKGFRYNALTKEFYVLRSTNLFEPILAYYASGVFHLPPGVCFDAVEAELSFWRIEQPNFQPCCRDMANREERLSTDTASDNSDFQIPNERNEWQIAVWKLWNEPNGSWKAKFLNVTTIFFTSLSILNMVIGSLPNLQYCNHHNKTSSGLFAESPLLLLATTHCRGTVFFVIVEALCTLWLSFEFVSRLITSPKKRRFLINIENVIDFLSAIPFYMELTVWGWLKEQPDIYGTSTVTTTLMLISHLMRIARLLKLCKYSEDLRILAGTFNSARRELFMLTMFTMFSLLIFATLLYYIEKDEIDTRFSSIPASCWWAIVTLTTAGYGDVTPQTTIGKIVAGVACVTGILMMALPIAVLVENFTSTYTKRVIVKPTSSNNFSTTDGGKTRGGGNLSDNEEKRKFFDAANSR